MFESMSQIPARFDGEFMKKPVRTCMAEFGGVLFIVFGLFSAYHWFLQEDISTAGILLAAACSLWICGRFLPRLLFHPWRLWMAMALALNKIMTPVILFTMWTVVVVPTAYVLRACGVDLVKAKLEPDANSYYAEVDDKMNDFSRLDLQF